MLIFRFIVCQLFINYKNISYISARLLNFNFLSYSKLKTMEKLRKVLFIFIGLFLIQSASSQSNNLQNGIQYFELRNFEQAAKSFEAYLHNAPNDINVKSKLAYSYKSLGDSKKALELYQLISDEQGVDSEVYFEYGDLLRSEAEFDLAKIQFGKYAKVNPSIGNYFIQSCDYALASLKNPSNCNLKNLETNGNGAEISPIVYQNQILFVDNSTNDLNAKSAQTLQGVRAAELKLNPNTPSLVDQVLIEEASGQGNVSFSDDGTKVFYSKSTILDITGKSNSKSPLAIYSADVNEKGSWTNHQLFKFCDSKYSYAFPTLANNGKTLYFSSNMPNGFGGYDIYISYRTANGDWTAPENMGTVINTPGNEISPTVNSTNLYFSSDWHNGFGGFDVFKTTSYGETWSDVENLGTCVNSTKDDYNFTLDAEGNGYFTSNRQGSKGQNDNYKSIKLKIKNQVRPTQIVETTIGVKSPLSMPISAPEMILNPSEYVDVFDDPELQGKAGAVENKVYFIQITALTNFTEQMEVRFKKYAKYGDVYRVQNDGVTKIRIGVFPQLNVALAQLKEIRKTGLKDAFVVGDVLDENRMTLIAKAGSDFTTTVSTDEEGKFKIRVAEFKAPDWFDASKVNDLGKIEHWTKSGYTIIILGSFNDSATAKETLQKIKSRGFKEAYIVTEEDGKLFRHE